jgi:hypothetical protein
MRGHELLGLPVVGPDGQDLGQVLDLRLVQDGPLVGAFAALRVAGFVVGRRQLASRLGYDRFDAQGPWLVARLVHWSTRHTRYLPWADATLEAGCVRSRLTELPQELPIP